MVNQEAPMIFSIVCVAEHRVDVDNFAPNRESLGLFLAGPVDG